MSQPRIPDRSRCQVQEKGIRCPNPISTDRPCWWFFSEKKLAGIRVCWPHWYKFYETEVKHELLKLRVEKDGETKKT